MKIKSGYLLREVAGNFIVVSIGQAAVDFNGMLTMNETGAFLWKKLEGGASAEELKEAMQKEYEGADEKTISDDVDSFIESLKKVDLLEDE